MGRTPKGEKALTGAERQKRYHEKQKQQTPELCKEINADRNVKQKSALQRIKSDHPDVYSKWRKAKNQYERKRRFGHKVEKYQASLVNTSTPATPASASTPSSSATPEVASAHPHHVQSSDLPDKYNFLEEAFKSLDIVISQLYHRSQRINFGIVQRAVQLMLHRDISEFNLAQIIHIYPNALRISQEKVRVSLSNYKYEMVITPHLQHEDGTVSNRMGPSVLLKRRNKFHSNLVSVTQVLYKEHLGGLVTPFPDIPAAELPKPPVEETFKTAMDVLEKVRKLYPHTHTAREDTELSEEITIATTIPKELKGINVDLIQRIRKREAAEKQSKRMCNPEREAYREKLLRLPELASILHSIFKCGRKTRALPIDDVLKGLTQSTKSMLTKVEMSEHFDLLASKQPSWISILNVSTGIYVKLKENTDINKVVMKLKKNCLPV